MGWPKGKYRGWSANKPPYLCVAPFISTGNEFSVPKLTRSETTAIRKQAFDDYIASGGHIEADRWFPGERAKAEAIQLSMRNHVAKRNAGNLTANKLRASAAEARRNWIVTHCEDCIFLRSRKSAIGKIADRLSATNIPIPSKPRLYADIKTIRTGWGRVYFSQAKDST